MALFPETNAQLSAKSNYTWRQVQIHLSRRATSVSSRLSFLVEVARTVQWLEYALDRKQIKASHYRTSILTACATRHTDYRRLPR